MVEFWVYGNECAFQVLEEVTRRTGRLTKQIKIFDLKNLSLRKMNRTWIMRDASCNKALEDYYPWTLGCIYLANSLSWLSTVWNAFHPFFPKRMVEKMNFLPPLSKLKKSSNYLKSILGYGALEDLPERYGGLNKEWHLPVASLRFQT